MFQSRKQVTIFAVVLGLAAAGVTAYYTMRVTEAAQPTERVVVAKATIPARTKVTEDLLVMKAVPKGALLPEAQGDMRAFVGKNTKQTILAGEQVLPSRFFTDRVESGLAFVIPPGRRAIAVGINEKSGVGGHIAAGDRVDLITTCHVAPTDKSGNGKDITKSIFALQDIEVLTVARKVAGEEEVPAVQSLNAKSGSNTAKPPVKASQDFAAKTLTLSLTPAEAESVVLMEASSECEIRFALRSSGDQEKVPAREATFTATQPLTSVQGR